MEQSIARQKILEKMTPKAHGFYSDVNSATSTDDFKRLLPQMPYMIYVHIPFCDAVCRDCVYSKSTNVKEIKIYADYLIREIELLGSYKMKRKAKPVTIYFGGGTPSLLPLNSLKKIMEKLKEYFIKDANPEVTLEVNPSSFDLSKMDEYRDLGINRLSIGVQSFDDVVLKEMGRTYTSDQVKNVLKKTTEAGWKYNIDLMYGFDSQTPQMFYDNVDYAINSGVSHIATYNLVRKMSHEERERIFIKQSDMYYHILEKFRKAGFIQYSVNEFARNKDSICKYTHDRSHLPMKENISFGVGAHGGTKGGGTYEKFRGRKTYMNYIDKKIPPVYFIKREDPEIIALDVLRALKMNSVIFKGQFGIDPTKLDFIKDLEKYGFIKIANKILTKKITVNEDYFFQYNLICSDIFFNEMRAPADPKITEEI